MNPYFGNGLLSLDGTENPYLDPSKIPQGLLAQFSPQAGPADAAPQPPQGSPYGLLAPMPPQEAPQGAPMPSLVGSQMPSFSQDMPQPPAPDLPAPGAVPAGPMDIRPVGSPMEIRPQIQQQQQAAQPGAQPQANEPGFFDKFGKVVGSIYGAGGPGDGLINLGLALASPGNKAQNLQRAFAMQGQQQLQRAQLAALQLKQAQTQMAMKGNVETLKKAFPGYSDEAIFGMAQNPALVQDAIKRVNPNETFKPLITPEERAAHGIPATDMNPYQMDQSGKVSQVGSPGTQVNINQQTEKAIETGRGTGLAKRLNEIVETGSKVAEDRAVVGRMGDLLNTVQTGNKTALLEKVRQLTGVALDPNTDNVQALNSAIQYLAPRLRTPGSGSQSDKELDNFLRSIPSLQGTPGGNQKILETFNQLLDQKQKRAEIATQWQLGKLTPEQAQEQLDAVPSIFSKKTDLKSKYGLE